MSAVTARWICAHRCGYIAPQVPWLDPGRPVLAILSASSSSTFVVGEGEGNPREGFQSGEQGRVFRAARLVARNNVDFSPVRPGRLLAHLAF